MNKSPSPEDSHGIILKMNTKATDAKISNKPAMGVPLAAAIMPKIKEAIQTGIDITIMARPNPGIIETRNPTRRTAHPAVSAVLF
jgi:hypothetical protein